MSLAMTGFAFFGMVLFAMWYMLRSCKKKPEGELDYSNPQSRGRYRPASLSPYADEEVPQVELGDTTANY